MKRRAMLGGGAALLAAAAGGTMLTARLLRKHYPKTAYDDLLDQITDREPAAALGRAVLKAMPDFSAAKTAAALRRPGFALADRAGRDAGAGRVVEVAGWILPQSVALYAALAAKV